MGRKSYQDMFQPYIDVVMEDLGLTGKVTIEWEFGKWRSMGGDIRWYGVNDKPFAKIRVSKASWRYMLITIMHELKHAQQYVNGYLERSELETYTNNRGKISYKWVAMWKGKKYDHLTCSRNPQKNALYMQLPWEKEAYAYQEEIDRLFPNCKLPQKKLVGSIGNTKFYKVKG